MQTLLADSQSFYTRFNSYALILLGFAIPLSNALVNLIVAALLLTFFLLADKRQFWQTIRQDVIALLALFLFLIIVVGIFYSPATLIDALDMLAKYRELLLIPIFIFLFRTTHCQKNSLIAFVLAMLLTLLISFFMTLGAEQLGKGTAENPFVFKNHITQGILMALAAYCLLTYGLKSKQWRRGLSLVLALLASMNLLFMTEGRSGYLVFFCLLILLVYQHWRWRGLVLIGMLLLLGGSLLLSTTNLVQRYTQTIAEDIRAYDAGLRFNSNALRYDFLRNGLQITQQAPLFGHGTGSFMPVYRDYVLTHTQHQHFSQNPHNEYLMISIQWGGLGLICWLLLLFFMWQKSYRLALFWQWQAQALVVTFVIGSLVNSLLLDSTEGHLFSFLAALFFSLLRQESSNAEFKS